MKKINPIIVTCLLIVSFTFLMACKNTNASENKKMPDKKADISDLVLIYHGATHRPDWNTNELKPYVYTEKENGFHWLFDGFFIS